MNDDEDDAVEFYTRKKAQTNVLKAAKPPVGRGQVFQSSKVYDEEELKEAAAGELGHISSEQKLEFVTDANG